ncbi:MAG: Fic family protein [Verrucomicrobia bacterium]|nr:Fic family protein [Verrucomicrobiota bacterium]
MKIPEKPTEYSALMESVEMDRWFYVLDQESKLEDGLYLHWDELRRRPAPEGLTHQEWWYVLKRRRVMNTIDSPLVDVQGRPFGFTVPESLQRSLHKIDLGGGGRIEFPEPITNAETRDRYVVNSLIEEAITSSQLEGAATTREVAKEMLRQGRKPRDKSERMILNNYITMREIRELRDQPLTPERVFALHRLVTEKTMDNPDAAGRFRKAEEAVHIVGGEGEIYHVPPPPDSLPGRLQAMCDFANGKTPDHFVHPAIRAIILHFWLAYDHPFVDGNGRTARALFYWSMLRSGYWLFEFVSISSVLKESPVKYERSFLYTETDGNDLTYFILDEIRVIEKAMERLFAYIKRKAEDTRRVESHLKAVRLMNHRQAALIEHALKHPGQRYSIASHRRSHNVAYQTARTDLLDLAGLNLLQQTKAGKTLYFYPEKDLESRLLKLEKSSEIDMDI